ncbi:hypothetical protein LPJ78_002637 [Coemansia sp. RSA 989]|nr:hypothetical protein BX667DRAFT_501679 [Coemansia mojavensis]KAJ1743233.1 hypothetical protein LPJ68_001123 [Coemansia sp. RSA 1086]KAJ1751847.1 hypothetical protein LPJ79_001689 [Coemansia sp. RSA 1821]KAJ1865557.1 hypothetical protein LPJ78_002637 [Coemansia sp. RSA 989]KAJ1873933.1 hypothetical protein LPJ55_001864 [Coemansia sp. RSA 990]KAJ2630015.1 hypothetical protein H4R22_002962 [Coemansia sp. RSA 1290]KAJ2650206.1 hypothetical protein IWW40_002579 [Coemansia sp. RSA 1250]KAJ26702
MDLEPTPSLPAGDGEQAGVPTNANEVSVVAVLCGTESCDPNTWNGFRLIDRTTQSSDGSDATDLGPLYRPQTSTTDEQVDEDLAHEKRTNKFATPIAIAIPLAAVIAFVVLFSLYRRKRRAKQKASEGSDNAGPYGQLESGGTSPATSETFNYNHQPIARLTSHATTGSNRTSMFTAATPPPPLPYRRSAHHETSRPQSLGPAYSPLSMNAQAQTAEAEAPLPEQPPPAHTAERIRANTFSDVPSDDLPPYVDPIEEAMAEAGSRPASLHDNRHSQITMQSPPPYDTITLPG